MLKQIRMHRMRLEHIEESLKEFSSFIHEADQEQKIIVCSTISEY